MQYFPLFVDTQALRVMIIGAGEVASRKLALLARTEAEIRVIAPDVCDEVAQMATEGRITLLQRAACLDDLQDIDILYLATADDDLNRRFALHAKAEGLWVNAVDAPALCNFITPSIVDRGRLQVAISTAGAAPVFARELRAKVETWLPSSLTELFDFIAVRRTQVQQRLPVFSQRKLYWEQFFRLNGDRFDDQTQSHFENAFDELVPNGEILLIDELTPIELLPLASVPLMQQLDWVSSNQDLPMRLSELVRRDAQRTDLLSMSQIAAQYDKGDRLLIYADEPTVRQLAAHFPSAKYLKPGAL